MKALLIDDHYLHCLGLETLLGQQLGFQQVFHAESVDTALGLLETHGAMDLVSLDDGLSGFPGVAGIHRLTSQFPEAPVVIFSSGDALEYLERAISVGARGFIPRRIGRKALVDAIQTVLSGNVYLPEQNEKIEAVLRLQALHQRTKESFSIATGLSPDAEESAIQGLLGELYREGHKPAALAFSDKLTGVANRRLFVERTECALKNARRRNNLMALIYLKLNELLSLGDRYGPSSREKALIEVAQRLSSSVREVDTVARVGGDEFALTLVDIETRDGVRDAAERIHRALVQPLDLPGGVYEGVRISMGVIVSGGDEGLRALLWRAEELLQRVNNTRVNQYIID